MMVITTPRLEVTLVVLDFTMAIDYCFTFGYLDFAFTPVFQE